MNNSAASWWVRWLGPTPERRRRVRHGLLALGLQLLFALWLLEAAALGAVPTPAGWWLAGLCTGGALLLLALIRSGWSERRFPHDPSLTLVHSGFGVVCAALATPFTAALPGVTLAVALLAVVWGAFKLDARRARWLVGSAFLLLAAGQLWPAAPPVPTLAAPQRAALLLMLAALVALALAVLLGHLNGLRQRLEQQHVELTEALERIRRLATHDELTGLPNRRALLQALQVAALRQARLGEPVALVMIDLDHFKAINDRWGHRAGDTVLRGFAERAQATLRGIDTLGRWGGEEFLLLLPDTTLAQAQACVERLREHLQRTPLDEVADGLMLGFSAGITAVQGPTDLDAAIERADRAMYRAKADGRGRSEIE